MADDTKARQRYNETRLLLMRLENVADECAEVVDGDLPGVDAALEGIASTSQALRSALGPEDFEDD